MANQAKSPRDYYEVLGVERGADDKAITDAFRSLAMKYHPDRNKEPGAEETFKEIAAAYAVLSDRKKREAYDARGFAGVSGFSEEDLLRDIDFGDLFEQFGSNLGGFRRRHGGFGTDLFGGLFGRRKQTKGAPIAVELRVPLERIANGGHEHVEFSRASSCTACHGLGSRNGTCHHCCPECQGTGRKSEQNQNRTGAGRVIVQKVTTCHDCQGRGKVIDEVCPVCSGSGQDETTESVDVKIPVGADEGLVLRVPGRGHPGSASGQLAGDLLIEVRSLPDPRFERSGSDLWRLESISVPDAVLGVRRTVPSLDGPVDLKIPAGAQPGLVLRIGNKGLPHFESEARGDLLVRLDVQIPNPPTPEQRKLYRQLRKLDVHPAQAGQSSNPNASGNDVASG